MGIICKETDSVPTCIICGAEYCRKMPNQVTCGSKKAILAPGASAPQKEDDMGNWPKGPWFVRDFGKTQDGDDCHFVFVQAGGPSARDGWDDDGKYMVISGVISRDAANLISAAPDLFDALQKIYGKLMMSDRDGDAVITKEDSLLAEAALAKAMGSA